VTFETGKLPEPYRSTLENYRKLSATNRLLKCSYLDNWVANHRKRPMKTYKNPHTGEVVQTRGGNHKTLNEWRKKHGKEAVQGWQQD